MVSIKGFDSYQYSTFSLDKKSSSDSVKELAAFSVQNISNEADSLVAASQIVMMATDIGALNQPVIENFDPKVDPTECQPSLCSFNGECKYQPFTKQYYCLCYGINSGLNCSFNNATQMQTLKDLALNNTKAFKQTTSGLYDTSFLKTVTSQPDLMSDDLFDNVHDLIYQQILNNHVDTSSDTSAHLT